MRLFFSDTFFEQVVKLKHVQKKILDFTQKFRENKSASGLHFEPLPHTTVGRNIRSARVDDNYRAIIGVIGGENYCLLYVDTHEKAYAWANGKGFEWNEHLQSCQIVPIQEEAPSYESASVPVEQVAGPMAVYSDEQLLHIGVPQEMLVAVRALQDLDGLEAIEKQLPEEAFENLFNLMDGESIDNIIAEIEEGKAKPEQDQWLSNNNLRHFVEITDDVALQRIFEQDLLKWQIFLHPSQRKLVNADYKGSVKVSGSAGTGKTVAALHRLRYLTQASDSKVLFTTFTNALSDNLTELCRKMDIPAIHYELCNIDKVVKDIAIQYSIIRPNTTVLDYLGEDKAKSLWSEVMESQLSEFDEDFMASEYIEVIVSNNITELPQYMNILRAGRGKTITRKQRQAVWQLCQAYEQLKQQRNVVDRLELFNRVANYLREHEIHLYTNVIADEFQDLSNPELRFLRALVKEGANDLFLTGDPFQQIYVGRKVNFTKAGINVRGKRSQKLKVNYRTTEEIKKMAVAVLKGASFDDMDEGEENNRGYVSLTHGDKPIYRIFNDANEEVEFIISCIRRLNGEGIALSEMCIAAPSLNLLKELQSHLHNEEIPFRKKDSTKQNAKDGIFLCTLHSLKGLEYRVVILSGINERNLPAEVPAGDYRFQNKEEKEQQDIIQRNKSLLYVSLTRARNIAIMTGYGKESGLIK